MLFEFQGIGGLVGQPKAGLLVAYDSDQNFQEANEYHGIAERHDQGDMPLFDPEMA